MDVVFVLVPMMLLFGFIVVMVFIWMAKSGHFDDLDGAANSIFMEDEYEEDRKSQKQTKAQTESVSESESSSKPITSTEASDAVIQKKESEQSN